MSENHKNRRKLLATVAICAALLGNGTAMAAEACSSNSAGNSSVRFHFRYGGGCRR